MHIRQSVRYLLRADEADRLSADGRLAVIRQNLMKAALAWREMAKSAEALEEAAATLPAELPAL